MTNIMKFKKKNLKRIFLYILIILAILLILAALLKRVSHRFTSFIVPISRPAQSIKNTKPLSAEIFFSNEPVAGDNSLTKSDFIKLITTEINAAQKTLEIAVYSIKSPTIKEAIYRASERGVKVTLILDFRKSTVHDAFFSDLPAGIKRLDLGTDGQQNISLMHHKFALIDRGTSKEKLIFGSFNWTELQAIYDRSFIMITDNPELVSSFGREFNRLTGGQGEKNKLKNKNYQPWDLNLNAAGYNYEVWFGPGRAYNGINKRIDNLLKEAQSDIKIMAWSFTDSTLAEEILRQARAGRKVTIIADSFNFSGTSSAFKILNEAKARENLDNLEILQDNTSVAAKDSTDAKDTNTNIDPFLHYHLLIIDNKKILFGTNNWSRGGFYANDESAIVSDDPKIIKKFLDSFSYNYQINKHL